MTCVYFSMKTCLIGAVSVDSIIVEGGHRSGGRCEVLEAAGRGQHIANLAILKGGSNLTC